MKPGSLRSNLSRNCSIESDGREKERHHTIGIFLYEKRQGHSSLPVVVYIRGGCVMPCELDALSWKVALFTSSLLGG